MNKNEMNSKPRRAQGGKGLLSRSISVQNPQESIPLVLILERRGRKNRENESHGREEGTRPGGVAVLIVPGTRERGEG